MKIVKIIGGVLLILFALGLFANSVKSPEQKEMEDCYSHFNRTWYKSENWGQARTKLKANQYKDCNKLLNDFEKEVVLEN